MSTILGREGSMAVHETAITGGETAVAEVTSWALNKAAGTISTNSMQSGSWDTLRSGRANWSAEVEANHDPSDTTGQSAFVIGATVACAFYPEGETSTKDSYIGTGVITKIDVSGDGSDNSLFKFSATITGNGAIVDGTVT